ncbi:MAG: hypothetical protein ACE5KM_00045 [Planctomycetaceae bacterium]
MSRFDLPSLMKDRQDGDERAAREIFDRYSRRLTALAEKHLSAKRGDARGRWFPAGTRRSSAADDPGVRLASFVLLVAIPAVECSP